MVVFLLCLNYSHSLLIFLLLPFLILLPLLFLIFLIPFQIFFLIVLPFRKGKFRECKNSHIV